LPLCHPAQAMVELRRLRGYTDRNFQSIRARDSAPPARRNADRMQITIIGTGYVGLVTGACLAEQGNNVLCLDTNVEKIDILNAGGVPLYEPGLKELIDRNRAAGRLAFTTDVEASVAHGEAQFIAVGTPSDEDGSADLSYVLAAAGNIGKWMNSFKVVIDKSTVPVGTADKVDAAIRQELAKRGAAGTHDFAVLSNPEFLKEGAAIDDFMRPDRIVIGMDEGAAAEHARAAMRAIYAPFNRNHDKLMFMDVRSAELTKYAANAMLATRISFMNELANLADAMGADIEMVRRGIGSDARIGYSFLYAGTGYGGSCLPKDVKALNNSARENDVELGILAAVDAANNRQKSVLVDKLLKRFGEDLTGRRFAVWGLAFKPNTDDMREAPSRVIARALLQRGAQLTVFDPAAMDEARRALLGDLADMPGAFERVSFAETPFAALERADALVILTEWKVFRSPDFAAMKNALKQPIVFDGRNLYEPAEMRRMGFEYAPIGRAGKA
jgi:UDPglucose 6-dehydrogenase